MYLFLQLFKVPGRSGAFPESNPAEAEIAKGDAGHAQCDDGIDDQPGEGWMNVVLIPRGYIEL